jgi:hypothetical protein
MDSLAEPKRVKCCASCGSPDVGASIDVLGDKVLLCAACMSGVRAGAGWGYWLPTKEDSQLPLAQGFGDLFKAARVLLEEGAEEDQIIPTLALANHLSHGVPRLVAEKERFVKLGQGKQAWNEEADRFARRFGGLRPVRVAHGVLILERRPVLITIEYALAAKTPEEAIITVYPHRTPLAKPEEVASLYDKTLADAGIAHDERRTGASTSRSTTDAWKSGYGPAP